jgi:putative tryptophan/tyrosine transport system substrate-binding protein
MHRARLAFAVAAVLCLGSAAAWAQPPAKVYRLGVLEIEHARVNAENLGALRQGLLDLGYVEGQNLAIEYRSAEGQRDRMRALATYLVRLDVDIIVTTSAWAALAARQATTVIPIVMASSLDPAAEGIVRSLARPGGNVTGMHSMAPVELGAQRLRLLEELVPGLSRVGVLWNTVDVHPALLMREIEKAARVMAIQLKSFEIQSAEDLDRAFEAVMLGQVDALVAIENYLTIADRARIAEFAAMSRLPAIYGLRDFVEAGGLMAYGTDRRALYRRSATSVHRVLTGTRPADLPIEGPTRFELVINLKAARAQGLTVPPSLLRRADHVIE